MTSVPVWWRLVGFGFRLLYNEMAWTYDAVSWMVSLGEWRRWQRAALKHLNVTPPARILEIAHGTANLQIDLRTLGYDCTGIDLSPYMGRIAAAKLRRQRIAPRLARARAQQLPFSDGRFAAVVSTFPTNFIVDPATIAETYRVLQPGGRLVFVPNGALVGTGALERGIELAYQITGQRGGFPADLTQRFASVGFTLRVFQEPYTRSIAQVVVCEKRAPEKLDSF